MFMLPKCLPPRTWCFSRHSERRTVQGQNVVILIVSTKRSLLKRCVIKRFAMWGHWICVSCLYNIVFVARLSPKPLCHLQKGVWRSFKQYIIYIYVCVIWQVAYVWVKHMLKCTNRAVNASVCKLFLLLSIDQLQQHHTSDTYTIFWVS